MNNVTDRFWSKVNIKTVDVCWDWQGGRRGKGYGSFWLDGHHVNAHRVAFEMSNNINPNQLMVLHKCDNRLCCNPNHLFLGDHEANMKDMKQKLRQHGWKAWSRFSPRKRLTEVVVQEILKLRAVYSQREIAAMFNASQAAIWKILNNSSRPCTTNQ